MSAIREDLLDLVRDAVSVSAEHCRGCRGYHVVWPLSRLGGLIIGVDADGPVLEPLVAAEIAAGRRRILIAGCSDSGIVAMVLRAAAGRPVAIHAIDICETPLALSQRFADRHGVAITTEAVDLAVFDRPGEAELVIAHSVLSQLPPARVEQASIGLAASLAAEGRLILATHLGGGTTPSPERLENRYQLTSAAVERFGLAEVLPPEVLRPLVVEWQHTIIEPPFAAVADIAAWAVRHGLALDRVVERNRRQAYPGAPANAGVIAVLSRAKPDRTG